MAHKTIHTRDHQGHHRFALNVSSLVLLICQFLPLILTLNMFSNSPAVEMVEGEWPLLTPSKQLPPLMCLALYQFLSQDRARRPTLLDLNETHLLGDLC